jgi:hypothetical protein
MNHGKQETKTAVSFGLISVGHPGHSYDRDDDATNLGSFSGLEVVPVRFAGHQS